VALSRKVIFGNFRFRVQKRIGYGLQAKGSDKKKEGKIVK